MVWPPDLTYTRCLARLTSTLRSEYWDRSGCLPVGPFQSTLCAALSSPFCVFCVFRDPPCLPLSGTCLRVTAVGSFAAAVAAAVAVSARGQLRCAAAVSTPAPIRQNRIQQATTPRRIT